MATQDSGVATPSKFEAFGQSQRVGMGRATTTTSLLLLRQVACLVYF